MRSKLLGDGYRNDHGETTAKPRRRTGSLVDPAPAVGARQPDPKRAVQRRNAFFRYESIDAGCEDTASSRPTTDGIDSTRE
jgi:hypothetical protein